VTGVEDEDEDEEEDYSVKGQFNTVYVCKIDAAMFFYCSFEFFVASSLSFNHLMSPPDHHRTGRFQKLDSDTHWAKRVRCCCCRLYFACIFLQGLPGDRALRQMARYMDVNQLCEAPGSKSVIVVVDAVGGGGGVVIVVFRAL
jgi:hypothetical protein